MDPSVLAMLFGSTGLPNIQAGIEPNNWPAPTTPSPVPIPAAPEAPYPEVARTYPTPPMPTSPYQEAYRSAPMPPSPTPSLGAALEPQGGGVPLPKPRPMEAPKAGEAPAGATGDALLKSLRGVQAPAAPQAQRVSTPHLPALRPIQGGGYMELLAQLGLGPQAMAKGLTLPSTLGQALGGR